MTVRTDWLLLFLGLEGGAYPADQVRVMKGMFLLDRIATHPVSGKYRFSAYDYGPFDSSVYRDLDTLEAGGLVNTLAVGQTRRIYELTEAGSAEFERLRASLPESELGEAQRVKEEVTSLGFDQLLERIYANYPAFALNSRARVAQNKSQELEKQQ